MRIFVIAVSGTGMGPLAGLLASLGHDVVGSDVAFDPPIGPLLEQWGVACKRGFEPEHLAEAPDLVVVGNLCRKDNPQVVEMLRQQLPYTHIGGALERFVLPGTRPLVVTGTHGKTTTAALAASLLDAAGQKPGYLIGGVPHGLSSSFRIPRLDAQVRPFVIEGDEYDTAFFEKTAKFLHYRAEVVILTSLEHDHIDIYPTFDSYLAAFEKLIAKLPANGCVVANSDDPQVRALVARVAKVPVVWYGTNPPVDGAHRFAYGDLNSTEGFEQFSLSVDGQPPQVVRTALMGAHNVGNSVAALAAVSVGYGLPCSALIAPLAEIQGVARRQQLLAVADGVAVYDDFAHHPTAVRETLKALRGRHPEGRLWAVFEPRSATACRSLHQAQYPESFGAADEVILAPVARQLPVAERLDVAALAEQLRQRGHSALALGGVDAIVRHLGQNARPGDTVALLSNGKFGGIHSLLIEALAARSSRQVSPG